MERLTYWVYGTPGSDVPAWLRRLLNPHEIAFTEHKDGTGWSDSDGNPVDAPSERDRIDAVRVKRALGG